MTLLASGVSVVGMSLIRRQVQIRLLPSAHRALREEAVRRELSHGELVELLLERAGMWELDSTEEETDRE